VNYLERGLLWTCLFLAISMSVNLLQKAEAGEPGRKIRVLYVGGDWKAQLPNYQGNTPMRGFFVKQEVEKAAPGRFDFTLWTSYEFLQYADVETLRQWDVRIRRRRRRFLVLRQPQSLLVLRQGKQLRFRAADRCRPVPSV